MRTIYTGGQVFTGALPLAEAFIVEDGLYGDIAIINGYSIGYIPCK